MQALFQPKAGALTVQYRPVAGDQLIENPPRFSWISAKPENDTYVVQISKDAQFSSDDTITAKPVRVNFYTPDKILEPGTYYWRYALLDDDCNTQVTEWSTVRSFTITEGLAETPLPARENRYTDASGVHPRLWLDQDRLEQFRSKILADKQYCGWDVFYEKSVQPWVEAPLIPEPLPYPNNQRVAKLWRKMYMDCQEVLHAVRHLSVAAVVLEDTTLLEFAKKWLMHVTSWDTEGPTSRDYNDEAAFRVAGALAWGYDWLFDSLSDHEREKVQAALFRRTEQVAFHVIERSKIHQVPYDSHAVRSLSSVLIPCCIALFDHEPKARVWLDYTLEYLACIYTPWGGADGGWAEGPHYWMTGMAYIIDGMNLVKNFNGLDLYQRPFFQKTGDFPLYVYSPDTVRGSFGDQANLGERPGLKVGFNMRQFGGVTTNGYYQWYYEQTKAWDVNAEEKFYNSGWWDFRFDEMMYRFDYPAVTPKAPEDLSPVKWFKDVGWVAMHHRMDDPNEHIQLVAKSSPYGSVSHSHGDQNAFLIHAFGEPLAVHSGYYVAFNSTMHNNWRRQTHSKNLILIDGKGQYAGKDKVKQMAASGCIETVESFDTHHYVRMNATKAYQEAVNYLENYTREIYFVGNSYFVIVDYVDLEQPGSVDWLFHSMNQLELGEQRFKVKGTKANLDGRFVYVSSGDLRLDQSNEFTGVDPQEYAGQPVQWQLKATTKSSKRHRIVSLLVPMKANADKYVSYFLDDQDHGVHIYFTDNGQTFRVEVLKAY